MKMHPCIDCTHCKKTRCMNAPTYDEAIEYRELLRYTEYYTWEWRWFWTCWRFGTEYLLDGGSKVYLLGPLELTHMVHYMKGK